MNRQKAQLYLEKHGLACPCWGSWDIEGGSLDFEVGEIVEQVSCYECGAQWTDVYKLAAVSDSETGATVASISLPAEYTFLLSPRLTSRQPQSSPRS